MSSIPRITYLINTNCLKTNNQELNHIDYMNIGYMAGRFGVNLNNNPYEQNPICLTKDGLLVNINSCTSKLFENNLTRAGIRFNVLA